MSEVALYKNLMLLGGGIDTCLSQNLHAPALILLYSAIDTTAWLDSDEEFATQASFKNWVEQYMLKTKPFVCTSLELYAARCGLLHTFTADSKLSKEGKARRVCYAWGNAEVEGLQRLINTTHLNSEFIVLHVNELYEGWRQGVLKFTQELDADHSRKSKVESKAARFFTNLGIKPVQELLAAVDGV